ncbi:hypothetical protein AgCh_001055 [Apium graveolens]
MFLHFIRDLDRCGDNVWGAAVLAYLYRELCKTSKKDVDEVAGYLLLLQLWAWERLPTLAPIRTSFILFDARFWEGQVAAPRGLRGLISQDNPVEAQNIFNKLLRFNDIQPNVVTYTTIIDGLCKRGHPSVAVKLFRYMEKKGCKPNAVTYNTIIDCLRKCRLVDQALGLLREMTRKGILPNLMTYSSLIQGLFDFNRWQDINGLLREMDISNISPDVHTFSILVDAYGKEGMIKDAEYVRT